ncbi:MAG: Dabb family protein [Steroidobacteraceae bacterium]
MPIANRRTFLASAAIASLSPVAIAESHKLQTPKLVHHVFFWLKRPDSKADRDRLLKGLATLTAIESVRGSHFGVPASTEKRDVVDSSFSVSEILFFDDTAGQKAYQDHPIHRQFVADCEELFAKVVVYDVISA